MTTEPESPFRDAALDAAWREHSPDEPPAHLDAAILAAAHDAVAESRRDVRKASSRAVHSRRWWMPLAAAAMVSGVVIGVSRLAPQDQAVTAPFEIDSPARDAEPRENRIILEREDPTARAPERRAAASPDLGAPMDAVAARPGPPPAAAPSVAFAPSPAEREDTAALGAMEPGAIAASESTRADPSSEAGSTFAPEPPSAPREGDSRAVTGKIAARANAQNAATPDADSWMERIRELYRAGKLAEAEKELVALRAAVPDADRRLPPDLRAWAKTVEP